MIFSKFGKVIATALVGVFMLAGTLQAGDVRSFQNLGGVVETPVLHLGVAGFDPLLEEPADAAAEALSDGYYVVQFDGPVQPAWRTALTQAGAEIFDYVPEFAFIIRLAPEHEAAVRELEHVRWLGDYAPDYRLDAGLRHEGQLSAEAAPRGTVFALTKYTVQAFPGEDGARLTNEIEALGGRVLSSGSDHWQITLTVSCDPSLLAELAAVRGVKWVEPAPERRINNNKAVDIMHVTEVHTAGTPFKGAGQVVAVCDTGLDKGSNEAALLHDDFEDGAGNARVLPLINVTGADGDDAADRFSGHGTHVAGSVLGNGQVARDGGYADVPAGMAPEAQLLFLACEMEDSEKPGEGKLEFADPSLVSLLTKAQGHGAHLMTNSWGSAVGGAYTLDSQAVDQYMWDHKDFLVLFAAGNEGVDLDGDGVVDHYSLDAPASAKNCLTVGASESVRDTENGARNSLWSDLPLGLDDDLFEGYFSDDAAHMAVFSSRGPCQDGRTKPDIVAPGTNILSTRSSVAATPFNDDSVGRRAYTKDGTEIDEYLWMSGTSMATPLTAGAAACMRQYLLSRDEFSEQPPSAAMIKAALVNSAVNIAPGDDTNMTEIPAAVPNNVEGWGRLDLAAGIEALSPANFMYFDEATGLKTGETREYYVHVGSGAEPLRVNLVWNDYPSAGSGGLVNDLDLDMRYELSDQYYPDNAVKRGGVVQVGYDLGGMTGTAASQNRRAVLFRASDFNGAYPLTLDSISFGFVNKDGHTNIGVDAVIYAADGPGGQPGTVLWRKGLAFAGGIVTLDSPLTLTGDFYVAVETNAGADYGAAVAAPRPEESPWGEPHFFYRSASGDWLPAADETIVRVNVFTAEASPTYDRVNNSVGITLDVPRPGTYTIRVNGYNVPQGDAQPYALVVSGGSLAQEEGYSLADKVLSSAGDGGGCLVSSANTSGWTLAALLLAILCCVARPVPVRARRALWTLALTGMLIFVQSPARAEDKLNAVTVRPGGQMFSATDFTDFWTADDTLSGSVTEIAYERRVNDEWGVEGALIYADASEHYGDVLNVNGAPIVIGDTSSVDVNTLAFTPTARWYKPLAPGLSLILGGGPDFFLTRVNVSYRIPGIASFDNDDPVRVGLGIHGVAGLEYYIMPDPTTRDFYDWPVSLELLYRYAWLPVTEVDEEIVKDINRATASNIRPHDVHVGGHTVTIALRWHF